jgi:alpha-L-fucosidase
LASSANGQTWNNEMTLEQHASGEFSYPAIIETHDGKVVVTYTYNRQKIKYLVLEW